MGKITWDAQNDRTLLLKLIETQGISVNGSAAQKIAESWPGDAASKPTAKAVSERFQRIKRMAGVLPLPPSQRKPGNVSTPSTKAKLNPRTPSKSTGRKRKTMKDEDESDADGHMTPDSSTDDTPSKSRKTNGAPSGTVRRSANKNFKGPGNVLGDAAGSPANGHVKKEPVEDPFNNFEQHKARAEQLRAAMTSDVPQLNSSFSSGYSNFHGIPTTSGSEFDSFDGGNDAFNRLTTATAANMANANTMFPDFTYATDGMDMGNVHGYTDSPAPTRERTPRKAGTKAKQGVSQFVQNQKELDREMGEASSVEDSAESQFEEDDDGVV
ncbi:hypothetical protein BDV96DRAFT_297191 [Lophiotrema nucula]|uniref:Myb-like domain-containing protein n=1 Tax=Lophiotrema nucula TaxID=690887 RepID=A0A6A5YMY3_9PLEO|nr:hypothetical protein BDV96DRAFT_297191 [Lophiotrema nucula]